MDWEFKLVTKCRTSYYLIVFVGEKKIIRLKNSSSENYLKIWKLFHDKHFNTIKKNHNRIKFCCGVSFYSTQCKSIQNYLSICI